MVNTRKAESQIKNGAPPVRYGYREKKIPSVGGLAVAGPTTSHPPPLPPNMVYALQYSRAFAVTFCDDRAD